MRIRESQPPSKTYVSALEARVKTLEALLHAASLEIPPSDVEIQNDSKNEPELVARAMAKPDQPVKSLDPRADKERLPEESGATAAALADIGQLRLEVETSNTKPSGEATNFTYFGPTSSRFLSNIADIQAGNPTDTLPQDLGYTKRFEDSNDDEIFEAFWNWQHIHFPIVNRENFMSEYNEGKRNSEFVSPLLLDVIYGFGENFGPHRRTDHSAEYFRRAESAVMVEIGTPRVATIQGILLMSMFQMGNGKIPVAWILNGMSVALSTRLGLHIDSSGLVAQGKMSQTVHDARTETFWAVFVVDRLHSIIMGVHPMHSRRSISTHRPSEYDRTPFMPTTIELAGTAPVSSPTPRNQEIPVVAWHSLRHLTDVVESMLTDIYSFDTPKRTAAQDYDLVTKNMLTLQAYTDDMPSPLRITAALRGDEPCLAFFHVYLNLFTILLNRPFVGPRPALNNANQNEAATRELERRCRSLAFGHCRKAALRIIELIRHLPKASPCFSTPYFIFSASTVLLLSPNDHHAIRGVQAGLKCLDDLEEGHYWVDAVIDARSRIIALAQRWGANLLFNNITDSSASPTTVDSNSPPASRDPSLPPPASPPNQPPQPPAGSSSQYQQQSQGYTWSGGSEQNMYAQNIDTMYLDAIPEAADMIPWAGAVEPSWGTMGTQQAPEYTLPGWEFNLGRAGNGYTPYQLGGVVDHSLDAYIAGLGQGGTTR
ncbi:Fungal specific transcription factor domain [Ceratobasidium sp. AG-Ba]|nr:Fungal specific transcription factor domain [Ceratobasidium sp. AG-Ba]